MIKLPRGNTLHLTAVLTYPDGSPYSMGENDHAVFTVKQNDDPDEIPLIKKIIMPDECGENGEICIKLDPVDTVGLETGYYLYDLAVCIDGKDFYTAVAASTFQILTALSDIGGDTV